MYSGTSINRQSSCRQLHAYLIINAPLSKDLTLYHFNTFLPSEMQMPPCFKLTSIQSIPHKPAMYKLTSVAIIQLHMHLAHALHNFV